MIEIIDPGPQATIQDMGRPGYEHLGVPRSGAADIASLALANRLVGNSEQAAGIEFTLGGAVVGFDSPAWIALTGAPATVTSGGRAFGMYAPRHVRPGQTLRIGSPTAGLRTYLAVRGGLAVPPVLGSRSTDLLSGLGPAPLRPGTRLPIGPSDECAEMIADEAPHMDLPVVPVLRIVAGPRDDWFTTSAMHALTEHPYVVSDGDRTGVRLQGGPLHRARSGELPTEGMVTGALQVPPHGRPVLCLADHPTTGGYPIIATVVAADVGHAAQLRPGQAVRFHRIRASAVRAVRPSGTPAIRA